MSTTPEATVRSERSNPAGRAGGVSFAESKEIGSPEAPSRVIRAPLCSRLLCLVRPLLSTGVVSAVGGKDVVVSKHPLCRDHPFELEKNHSFAVCARGRPGTTI